MCLSIEICTDLCRHCSQNTHRLIRLCEGFITAVICRPDGNYIYSDRVVRNITRYNWRVSNGVQSHSVKMIVTPKVKVRCVTL